MGTVYDFLRIVRVGLPHALRKLWELGYVTACSLWFFGVCLRLDSEIRGSMLLALFAGAALYGLSLRPVLCRLWDKIVCWETIQAGKVERIWKKILIFVKKLFAKLQKAYTIKWKQAAERCRRGKQHEEADTASGDLLDPAFRTSRIAYPVERENGGAARTAASAGTAGRGRTAKSGE
ncbi:MAG: hypothetical protein KBS46_07785 [Clostridiales bacterium]|nr:hypothetical protein [Candidatus Apopatocola equi]